MPDTLRSLLVETVDAAPPVRTIRRSRFVAAAIAAFALAGAATGGAISAAALVSQDSPVSQSEVDFNADQLQALIVAEHATTFGQQFAAGGSGTTIISLGLQPLEASSLALGLHCIDAGTFDEFIDDVWVGSLSCADVDAESTHGGGGGLHAVTGGGNHTLRIESVDSARFVVWAIWATEAGLPEQSDEQAASLADGTVTREEYLAGFDRFAACMGAAGYPMSVGVDRSPTVLSYAIVDDAVQKGVDTQCYVAEFEEIDSTWQIANQDTSESTEIMRECLRAAGIEPAYETDTVFAQLQAAGLDIRQCS